MTDAGYAQHLTPAHCHPTEELRAGKDWDTWIDELRRVELDQICLMSTDTFDQPRVAEAARQLRPKVIPCFGMWLSHKRLSPMGRSYPVPGRKA